MPATSDFLPRTEAPRRVGRPASADSPTERNKQLRCLFRRRVFGLAYETIAFEMKVSTKTVKRWCRLARAYDEAASDTTLAAAIASKGDRPITRRRQPRDARGCDSRGPADQGCP